MKLLKATKIKSSQLGRIPDSRELAEEIGWLPDEVDDIRSIAPYDCSLDTPFPSGDKTILDALPDRGSVAPDDEIIEKETREKLDEALEVLDSRSRDVVELWFGFRHLNVPKSPKQMRERNTLDQIGQHFGLTRERVRQIKAQALPELKKALLKRGISSSRPSA
ncbi:MAG: sigma-70 family RNA polymerase sigma factor [Parcubacteria group bacterium]|nr:sigma-70 family RNA polymerase sigma factor [Parcubacteria group bacterium]